MSKKMSTTERVFYNCSKCPAYCCTYAAIRVTKADLTRLAKFFGISAKRAFGKFTKKGEKGNERVLRHRKDEHFGSACRFLDQETRQCTVYEARPKICRAFPDSKRCGYYDFLCFERRHQDDPETIATTWNF